MKKDNELLELAHRVEACGVSVRKIATDYYMNVEFNSCNAARFAGSFCSMASSILCELYETQKSDFNIDNANNVLREWGLDELVD